MEEQFKAYIEYLKVTNDFKVVDTHVHPMDVMGVIHATEQGEAVEPPDQYPPCLLEQLGFGRAANALSRVAFSLLQSTAEKDIRASYASRGAKRLKDEMNKCCVDTMVLLPVEPWVDTEGMCDEYGDSRFIRLGSPDIHRVAAGDVESLLSRWKSEYGIVGVKLHPNLQDFKPQPSDNPPAIRDTLTAVYNASDRLGLYLLFHGGLSTFGGHLYAKYPSSSRSRDNALLKNFIRADGTSEVLGEVSSPIVIAHVGHQGLNRLDSPTMHTIAETYPHVRFDTAATSAAMIGDCLDIVGTKRVLLGSDALYNRSWFAMRLVHKALLRCGAEDIDAAMCDILGRNFETMIAEAA